MFLSPILTVTTVWNTAETGDINTIKLKQHTFFGTILFTLE